MQQVYKLFGAAAATTDGVASMDIRADGLIVGVLLQIEMDGGGAADGQGAGVEISFLSSSGHSTNDTTGSIAGLYLETTFTTSGAAVPALSQFIPMEVPVNSGERLFMHIQEAGTTTQVRARCWLYIEEKAGSSRPRAARR